MSRQDIQLQQSRKFFFDRLRLVGSVSEASEFSLSQASTLLDLPKNDFICRKGQRMKKIYFVVEGLIESSLIADNGKKVVQRIYKPGDFIWDHQSVVEGSDSIANYKTLSHSSVLMFELDELQTIVKSQADLWSHAVKIALKELMHLQERVISEMSSDTSEKYLEFLKEYQGLVPFLSNKKIAEFLGVTEQGLHKVRTKLKKKQLEQGLSELQ
ncbi:MAG: Crp/Fnr family transcriptional regulator [Bdellovibrionales bacterium]|nr:Crp/Fnr family transcriptional regulator [Bdellovibrionales bacterium]